MIRTMRPCCELQSRLRGALLVVLGLALSQASCGGEVSEEWQNVAREKARRQRELSAEQRFRELSFDTVTWESDRERSWRGQVVYRNSCKRCHGATGAGDGQEAREQDLDVPPIGGPDWLYSGDMPEIRRRIFVGHGPTMPTWGLAGLSARDVDAAAHHLDTELDPEAGSSRED